jgi:hypothetical protein
MARRLREACSVRLWFGHDSPSMQRRTFLRLSILGAAVLGVGTIVVRVAGRRSPADARADADAVLRGVIPALLAGVLPLESDANQIAQREALQRTQAAIAGLPPAARAELDQLFGLLASHPGRWLAGVDWAAATPEQASAFLQRWRTSSFDLFVAGYQAMHDLVLGSWYADASSWDSIGYPGPTKL